MVRPPKKHSMVMVSSKTIENLQWSLQNHWNLQWFPKKHWTCQWSSQINILLKQLNYPVVTITILIWLCCSKVYCQSSLIFIAAHCSCKPNLPHANYHFACFIQWPRLLLNHSFESLFCSWHYILHGVYDILRHSICCIVLISHCEIISGVIRYGPYHLDSTDVHLHVLLKICIFRKLISCTF